MLIVRAPVRISFGGGGTDLETYYARHGGLVLSAAISRYCYAIITPGDPEGIQISSADMRLFNNRRTSPQGDLEGAVESPVEQNEVLQLPWAVLRRFGVRRGLNIFLASEVPPGTGLGSSSAMAVALSFFDAASIARNSRATRRSEFCFACVNSASSRGVGSICLS